MPAVALRQYCQQLSIMLERRQLRSATRITRFRSFGVLSEVVKPMTDEWISFTNFCASGCLTNLYNFFTTRFVMQIDVSNIGEGIGE